MDSIARNYFPPGNLRKHTILEQLRRAVSFRHVAVCGLDFDGFRFGDCAPIDTDLPPAYLETYFDENLKHADPLILLSRELVRPISDVEAFEMCPPPQRLQYLLRAYDIGSRFLVPIARDGNVFGAVCFSTDRTFSETEKGLLVFLAEALHREFSKRLGTRVAVDELRLSERELLCLSLAAQGMTSEKIADVSALSTETVNSHMKSATRKLQAGSRAHAIAQAIRKQIIS